MHAGSLSWLAGTLALSRAFVNVIGNTCAFPAIINESILCARGLLLGFVLVCRFDILTFSPCLFDYLPPKL